MTARGLARRSTIGLLLVMGAGGGLWYAIHRVPWLGPMLADGARAVVGPKPVAVLEDVLYAVQDRYNRWRYGDAAPTSYWSVPPAVSGAPSEAVAAQPAAVAIEPEVTAAGRFPPPGFTPPVERVATGADGVWIAASRAATSLGRPVMVKTMVHPDPRRPYAAVAVVAMDLAEVRLHAMPGTVEPRGGGVPAGLRTGMVEPSDLDAVLSAFNGGFLSVHGQYGMMVGGHRLHAPRSAACTVAIYKDGKVRIRSWPEVAGTEEQMDAYRQTPQCLVEQGKLNPTLTTDNTHWGAAVGGDTVIRRSAIGVSADGRSLFFGMGDALSAKTIAEAMAAAGAHDAAQLDVNYAFPRFVFLEKRTDRPGEFLATGLCPGFTFRQGDYVRAPMFRDFFYVTRKPASS
jgi:hypothetical protein